MGGPDVGAFCAEGDRVAEGVGADTRGVVEGITAGSEVGTVKGDDVDNAPTGAVVLAGCVVSVNGGEDRSDTGAALGIPSGPGVDVT